MLGKIDEVAKETEQIIKDLFLELRYVVNQTEDATQLVKHIPKDNSLLEVTVEVFGGFRRINHLLIRLKQHKIHPWRI